MIFSKIFGKLIFEVNYLKLNWIYSKIKSQVITELKIEKTLFLKFLI